MLAGAGWLAMAGVAGSALAAEDHSHQQHGGGKFQSLANASADCMHVGQTCLAHCHVLLGQGDKELGACAASVTQMLATCEALMKLAAGDSKYTPKIAALALVVCEDSEKECRKHEKKHPQCKDCAEACAACAKECKKAAV
jgi:Cys-rich four helix bundle protein (predicted Tat secretion target)